MRIVMALFVALSGFLVVLLWVPFFDALNMSVGVNAGLLPVVLGLFTLFMVLIFSILVILIIRGKN